MGLLLENDPGRTGGVRPAVRGFPPDAEPRSGAAGPPSGVRGFPPLLGRRPRVLVLGSLPGAESLRRGEYYAHPRNAFWPIMGVLTGAGPALPYPERCRALTAAGIALWDVLASGSRRGSLDVHILRDSEEPNDLAGLILREPGIRAVVFNGGKAREAFRRHISRLLPAERKLTLISLPSTSPAHAGRSFGEKLQAWRVLETLLPEPPDQVPGGRPGTAR